MFQLFDAHQHPHSFWTRDSYGKWNPANRYGPQSNAQAIWGEKFYILVYGLCVFYFIFSMLFRGTFLYWWALGAACRFQKKALHRVLYAPLGYFLRVCRVSPPFLTPFSVVCFE